MGPTAVCTTFPNAAWDVYARASLESFARFWPKDVQLFVYLDDAALVESCAGVLADRVATSEVRVGKLGAHEAFLRRNLGRDGRDFRFQASRFSHKIAALKATSGLIAHAPEPPAHLIWMDADVITAAPVTHDWLAQFLPRGAAHVSYLGRKDCAYSECGFMAFRVGPQTRAFIDEFWALYETDAVFQQVQWHDSWLFDRLRDARDPAAFTSISEGVAGLHVWLGTKLAERLEHWKGPIAKHLRRPVTDAEADAIALQTRTAPRET